MKLFDSILWLVLIRIASGAGLDTVYLSNNFRELQPESPNGRVIYKTTGAGGCSDVTWGPTASRKATFPLIHSTDHHWVYADQENWDLYHKSHGDNECFVVDDDHPDAFPGESPIDLLADAATVTNRSSIALFGMDFDRRGLTLSNTGNGVELAVCSGDFHDCGATASFGTWPKTLRGLYSNSAATCSSSNGDDGGHHRRSLLTGADDGALTADTYYLKSVQLHWGSENSIGSEHAVCGASAAAEMHLTFVNRDADVVNCDRADAASGGAYVVIAVMLEGGAAADNADFSSIFDAVPHAAGDTATVATRLSSLLPDAFDTAYYTYAGSLTAPPCSQQVTWFIAANSAAVSDGQLELLRKATTTIHGHDNSYKAIMFPFVAIVIGTATEYFLDRNAPWVPYTVAVMVEGMLLDWLASYGRVGEDAVGVKDSSFQVSLDMWANIDGHLLLYAFLPALLFGDAMGLSVHMFERTFFQCLLLACPGVLFGTFLTGWAAMKVLPYDWDFNLAMAFGSILAATDPVAVVALLKAVGASPKLTMQITGESLMNDGTAIVLFTLFMDFHAGKLRNPLEIAAFFLQMSVAGPLLGLALGLAAYLWMARASRRFSHSDITVQTSITVCCAYLSFFMGESEAGVSGVLCVVAAALVLAKYAWPVVVSHDSLENVWHAVEYFGNTLIFVLAGVISRRALMSDTIRALDYAYLFLFYLVMTAIRGAMIVLGYPALKRLGYGTTPKDAFFMVYGGLRGAVGLALAISVKSTLDDVDTGNRVVFFVSGLAFLTLIINGTTSGLLLRKLGMIGTPALKEQMIAKVRERVVAHAEEEYDKACCEMNHDARDGLDLIANLRHMSGSTKCDETAAHVREVRRKKFGGSRDTAAESVSFYDADEVTAVLNTLPPANVDQVAMMRETFLGMVRAGYWEMVEAGHLPTKGNATLELLKSVDVAIDDPSVPLADWAVLEPKADVSADTIMYDDFLECLDKVLPSSVTWDNELHYLLNFKTQETAYYICNAFIESHGNAQVKLATFFGDDPTIDSAEEATIVLESLAIVARARAILGKMSVALIAHIKTMVVAEHLVELQQTFVHHIVEQGVLSHADAETLEHELSHDRSNIEAARKARAHALAKGAAKGESSQINLRRPSALCHSQDEEEGDKRNDRTSSSKSVMVKRAPSSNNYKVAPEEAEPPAGDAAAMMVDDTGAAHRVAGSEA